MERLKKYRASDAISEYETICLKLKLCEGKLCETDIEQFSRAIEYFVPREISQSRPYLDQLSNVQSQCSKFWDLKCPFSYELGCRYQKINFDFVSNVDGEKKWLKEIRKLYVDSGHKEALIVIDETLMLLELLIEEMIRFFENLKK